MNWFKKIFSKQKLRTTSTPKIPSDWNKTVSDLMDEMELGHRKEVGSPELDWALEYERNQIPQEYHFPRQGDLDYLVNLV